MLPLGLIAAGIGAGIKLIKGAHQNKLANNVVIPDATYTKSPYADNTLELAKQMFNSQMPGEATAERNIQGNNANANAQITRGSTDASQALALMAGSQGETDQAFTNLDQQAANYKMQTYGNLASANQGETNENDKVYQDMVRKQMMAINEKNALRGASTANVGNGMNDLISGAFMYDQMRKK